MAGGPIKFAEVKLPAMRQAAPMTCQQLEVRLPDGPSRRGQTLICVVDSGRKQR